MNSNRLDGAVWRKSSRSNGQGNCLEVAFLADGEVALRESEAPDQVVITDPAKWRAFIEGVQLGEFELPR